MHILIVNNSIIPALKYGGTERVIWWLGKELARQGHRITYLVAPGSHCPFAEVLLFDPNLPFNQQVPDSVDVIHLSAATNEAPLKPYLITMHGNVNQPVPLDVNTVFVSRDHGRRYGSESFVHNCIDVEDYGPPALNNKRNYIHFLGDAAWRVKNVRGAIQIARQAKVQLQVIGGFRFNLNMGIRLTFDPNTRFHGMKGGAEKNKLINGSKALLFPVLWSEPFGLALIESLYFGCAVIGTPYGSLPELVPPAVGFLSNKRADLVDAVKNLETFHPATCHQYVMDNFTADKMAMQYLAKYERVLNGEQLNARPPQLIDFPVPKFLPFD